MTYINRLARRVIQAAPSLAGFAAPISWLWRIDMSTADATPIASPYIGEVGTMTAAQVDGTLAIAGGVLTNTAQATPVEGDLGVRNTAAIARESGIVLLGKYTPSVLNTYPIAAWNTAASISSVSQELCLRIETPLGVNDSGYISLAYAISTGVEYEFALVLFPTGGAVFIRGGAYTNWTLLWVRTTGSTANLYALFGHYNGTGDLNFLRVRKVNSLFPSQFGWVTARVTSFTQSVGSELLQNNSFATWSGDNPSNWTVIGESAGVREVTQVASGGGVGTGATRFFAADATLFYITQFPIFASGDLIEVDFNVSAVVSGSANVGDRSLSTFNIARTTTGRFASIRRTADTGAFVRCSTSGGDVTIDDISYKLVTRNIAQASTADAIHDFEFTVPASPIAGQEIHLLYRINAANDELNNCWDAYLQRNSGNTAWDFRLDSISAGVRTNRINVTGVGTPDAMRVIVAGNLHDCFTRASGAWTKRGTQINNSSFATATLINTLYSTGTTPTALTSYPRSKTSWSELSRAS